jgi:hypothetical protein
MTRPSAVTILGGRPKAVGACRRPVTEGARTPKKPLGCLFRPKTGPVIPVMRASANSFSRRL